MASASSISELTTGKRYLLQQPIGRGGMGIVFLATDRLTGQPVALKRVTTPTDDLLFNSRDSSLDVRLALAREFQLLAGLHHPNIITVLDYGFDAGHQPYFTMEYLVNARTIVQAASGAALEVKLGLIVQTLQALAYLHRRGVLHRDLKPHNVLVQSDKAK